MAEEITHCEYSFKVSDGIPRTCSRPARRVSKGRHYCREHFNYMLEPAKHQVLALAAKLVESPAVASHRSRFPGEVDPVGLHALAIAMEDLEKLGWDPGD